MKENTGTTNTDGCRMRATMTASRSLLTLTALGVTYQLGVIGLNSAKEKAMIAELMWMAIGTATFFIAVITLLVIIEECREDW
jgi:hypothetical protein